VKTILAPEDLPVYDTGRGTEDAGFDRLLCGVDQGLLDDGLANVFEEIRTKAEFFADLCEYLDVTDVPVFFPIGPEAAVDKGGRILVKEESGS
jgi:hypothetical protein